MAAMRRSAGWRGLPSMAATAREAKAPFDREALRDVERYAAGDYLQDLLRGERDTRGGRAHDARASRS